MEKGHLDAALALLRKGAKATTSAIGSAAKLDDSSCLFAILADGQSSPQEALSFAASNENSVAAKALFQRFPELKSEIAHKTMLNEAAMRGSPDFVQLLIEQGANVNQIDNTGATPLMRAAMTGKTDAIRVLLASGANSQIKNRLGYDASYYAQLQHQTDAALVLQQYALTKNAR